jgi:hypothetical protein
MNSVRYLSFVFHRLQIIKAGHLPKESDHNK